MFYWNLTGEKEKAREKEQDQACALLMGHIKYSGSEPCRGNTIQHSQSSRDSKAFPSA